MPQGFLKEVLLQYDSQKRIEFLETLSNDDKEFYIDTYAPVGSKARDIYNLDYDRLCDDAEKLSYISSNSEVIFKNFVIHLRTSVRKNTGNASKVDGIITAWSTELSSKYTVRRELKAV